MLFLFSLCYFPFKVAVFVIFSMDNSNIKAEHSINSVFGNAAYAHEPSLSDDITEISALAECYLFAGVSENHYSGSKYLNSLVMPWFRGKVPGLVFSVEAGFKYVSMPHIKTINGMNYFQIPSVSSNPSCAWINTEQW